MGEPSDNVFVGDLPLDATTEQIQTVFSAYGTVVQARVLQPKTPGQKASALIRFGSVEEATWVVQNLNGNLAEGLQEPVVVRFANAPGANRMAQGYQQGYQQMGAQQMGAQQMGAQQMGAQQMGGYQAQKPVYQPAQPSENIWVGDLPPEITTEQVQAVFAAYGTIVTCRAIAPKMLGGKASAMIRLGSVDEASWIVANLNGNLAEGLQEPVLVRFAQQHYNNGGAGYGAAQGYGKGKGGFRNEPYGMQAGGSFKGQRREGVPDSFRNFFSAIRKSGALGELRVKEGGQIYINNLPSDTTDHDLYKLFSPFGPILANGAKAMCHPDGSCKGFGFVDFLDPSHAQAAIAAVGAFSLPDGSSVAPSIKVTKAVAVDPNVAPVQAAAGGGFDGTGYQAAAAGGIDGTGYQAAAAGGFDGTGYQAYGEATQVGTWNGQ